MFQGHTQKVCLVYQNSVSYDNMPKYVGCVFLLFCVPWSISVVLWVFVFEIQLRPKYQSSSSPGPRKWQRETFAANKTKQQPQRMWSWLVFQSPNPVSNSTETKTKPVKLQMILLHLETWPSWCHEPELPATQWLDFCCFSTLVSF